jgi:transposase
MDNAKYHKRIEGLPRCLSALRKDELKTWLLLKGAKIEQIKTLNRKELYELARDNPAYKGTPVVETIAAGYGFRIEWLPPYHPTLNPIEEAWGIVKGYVADNNDGKDFNKVKDFIFEGFSKVNPDIWAQLVNRTYTNEDEFIKKLHLLTTEEINDLIIPIDSESEDDESESNFEYEELTFEDIIEIRDRDGVVEEEEEENEDDK